MSDQINYDGPDQSVECAFPPCKNRLRKTALGGPQFCSREHRDGRAIPQPLTIDGLAEFVHTPRKVGMLPVGAPVVIEDDEGRQRFITEITVEHGRLVLRAGGRAR